MDSLNKNIELITANARLKNDLKTPNSYVDKLEFVS